MPNTITALPLRPDTTVLDAVPTADGGWAADAWNTISGSLGVVPGWIWAALIGTLTLTTFLLLPALRAQAFKAGKRDGKKQLTDEDRKDRRLLIAALIPAVGFWIAVLVGSGRGLIAFGRDDLNWKGGWEYLVPFTLDGVAISFGLLAFRAVRKKRSPDRAVRIAAGAMVASSAINFLHEVGGSKLGASYLAILSLLGMLIFDELLAQFEEGSEHIVRQYPKFGLRWITWPTNTVCAWFAWRNYPVAKGVDASIRAAVDHLETVRSDKALKRAETVDAPAWWMILAPWVRSAQLATALSEQRSALVAEQTRSGSIRTEMERLTELHRNVLAETAERARKQAEQIRSEVTEHLSVALAERDSELADREAEVARLRAELAHKVVPITRSGTPASRNTPERKTSAPRSSDTEALQAMFSEHPERGYEWTDREVNRITGAGFSSRAPRLTGMASQHQQTCPEQSHQTCYSERSGSVSDDSKERAS